MAAAGTTNPSFCYCFSTEPDKKEEHDAGFVANAKHQFMATVVTPQNQFYALVAGGTIGAYIISRGFLQFTSFFTHLTPTTIAKWGFYTGFGTASCE